MWFPRFSRDPSVSRLFPFPTPTSATLRNVKRRRDKVGVDGEVRNSRDWLVIAVTVRSGLRLDGSGFVSSLASLLSTLVPRPSRRSPRPSAEEMVRGTGVKWEAKPERRAGPARWEAASSLLCLSSSFLISWSNRSSPCSPVGVLALRSSPVSVSLWSPPTGSAVGEDESVESERREGTELDHESGAFRILLIPAFLSQLFL